jgi:hypothetical protein
MLKIKLVPCMVLALVSGCFGGGMWSPAQSAEAFRRDGLSQASFDLGCPAEKLTLTPLHTAEMFPGSTIGVDGCGKRATYIGNSAGSWMKNSETTASPAH